MRSREKSVASTGRMGSCSTKFRLMVRVPCEVQIFCIAKVRLQPNRARHVQAEDWNFVMASNLKALLTRATPLTTDRAHALIEVNMKANAQRYQPASESSEVMESEDVAVEDQDHPAVPER